MNARSASFAVVVSDNGSTDGSVQWIRDTYPETAVLENGTNLGFSGGNNVAIRSSTARYVLLLNNDVEVEPDWLDPLVDRAESDQMIGAVVPKILQYDDRTSFEYAGAAGGYLDDFGYPFARGRIFDTIEVDTGQYDEAADVFWGSGAALLLRRSALDRAGLLDERFFMHMEEIDLCWRLRRHGFRVVFEPQSRVYHIGGASLPSGDPRKTYYNFRNSLLTLYKNGGRSAWPRRFALRLVLDALAVCRFAVSGRFGAASAVMRAYVDAHKMKAAYREVRTYRDEAPPSYRGSVVADYFLRRRRRFSELPQSRFRI